LVFRHDPSQRGFQAADEPQNRLVEPQAKLGSGDPLSDLPLDRGSVDRPQHCAHAEYFL
jgi:hypothetical protein